MNRTKVKVWVTKNAVWFQQRDAETNQTYFVSNTGRTITVHELFKNYTPKSFSVQEKKMFYNETYIFETEWDAIDFAEDCGDAFVRYTGSSWITQDEGDYGVVVQGFGL